MRSALLSAASLACTALPAWSFFFGPPFDPYAITVLEYVQDIPGHTGRYMLVTDGPEKFFIDGGGAGPGWRATGHRLGAFAQGSGRPLAPVCRFYAPSSVARFYTANPAECEALRSQDLGWTFEGVRFEIAVPSGGACATGLVPMNRLYNNLAQFSDTNHRYLSDPALRASLVAQGWTDEGIAFCATSAGYFASKSIELASDRVASVAECENEDLGGRGCLAMNGLAASFPTRIPAPIYLTGTDPRWSQSFSDITAYMFDVYTGQPAENNAAAVAFHSFVQHGNAVFPPSSKWGFHLNGVDRVGGSVASMEPMFRASTRPPPPGGLEARLFPWRTERESFFDLAFNLHIQTILRPDAGSHAYGAPMLEFRDVRSGGGINVSVLTYATFPPGDFVGVMDATGNVYVSTTFGANPSFGERISGDFVACDGVVSTSCRMDGTYRFRITRADFARILAMARGANAVLSGDPNDYMLVSGRFRNGVVNDGRLGVQLSGFKVDLYGY